MNFTKGVIYDFDKVEIEGETEYITKDDNGFEESFFNLNVMFEKI